MFSSASFGALAPILLKGSLVTLELTICSVLIGMVIGIFITLMRISHFKTLSTIAYVYTWIFRGTPLLLQIYIIYFGLPSVGIVLPSFLSALIGLSLNSAAYMAEIIRGGILAVDKGQFEAAKALGFSYAVTMRKIILPQTIRIIIPSIGNELIAMLKDTSLVSVIAMSDLMRNATLQASSTGNPWMPLLGAGVMYLIMTTVFTVVFDNLEKKLSVY
ncbi:amino acid ABC transporter permease [Clostridium oryzae]|uniref:Arginine transport system permease protein ArtQ n=1 Tax=Clostridium oryzae TaxID=1450648 RepID=A0A1V4IYJ1_9CLOT|nr:amino acid ABC transporter permease [Clostridium oryzae]OPJ65006.1 arginine transport system permease protein ArtQ [Clostridium oryzae]